MTALTKQLGSQHRRELVAAPQAGPEGPDEGKTDRGFAYRRDMSTSRDEAHVSSDEETIGTHIHGQGARGHTARL